MRLYRSLLSGFTDVPHSRLIREGKRKLVMGNTIVASEAEPCKWAGVHGRGVCGIVGVTDCVAH